MNESWTAFYVILGIFSIGYGIFLIVLHIRLWVVLGYIRTACIVLLSQNDYQKKCAIELYKKGQHNIYSIANELKVIPEDVSVWIESDSEIQAERENKKSRAIEMYKNGNNNIYDIARQVSSNYEIVEKWIKNDPEIQADKKSRAIEMYKNGKRINPIANKIGATSEEVKKWIESDKADVEQDE